MFGVSVLSYGEASLGVFQRRMGVLPSACAAAGAEKLVILATPAHHNIVRTRFSFRAPIAPQVCALHVLRIKSILH